MTEQSRRLRHLSAVEAADLIGLDSAGENMVPAMALNADHTFEETWNGWARPVATAAAFSDFLVRWRLNDPHGTWGKITEVEGALRYEGSEGNEPEDFPRVGTTHAGEALYDLTGWVWVRL